MANLSLAAVLGSFQGLLLILSIIFVRYDDRLGDVSDPYISGGVQASGQTSIERYYPMFQDVHVMIFIGFGFLMVFLKEYGFGSVGFNFMIGALCIQYAIFTNTFWHRTLEHPKDLGDFIYLDVTSLITGDFAAGAVLISFGAVLGKVSPTQLVVMIMFELFFYSLNEAIGVVEMKAVDMGGSMFVHSFGAYFGLAVSYALNQKSAIGSPKNGSSKTSDTFAMIGAVFLWIFWPSFNGAMAPLGSQQHRVVINTVLGLCGSAIAAFISSNFLRHGHKFDMVDIQNASLAGGVAVGSSSDLVIEPWGAVLIGLVAGVLSVVGYVKVSPFLEKLGIQDTCGVHNLHGMPGILGGICGAISAALAKSDSYGDSIGLIFPARAAEPEGDGRSAGEQGNYQMYALLISLSISISSGYITGLIMKLPIFSPISAGYFTDSEWWEMPEEQYMLAKKTDGDDVRGGEVEMSGAKKENQMVGSTVVDIATIAST